MNNSAAVKLAVLGNILIFPVGFVIFLLLLFLFPFLNNIGWIFVAALPQAALAVFLWRSFNRKFELKLPRYAYVLICAFPSVLISSLVFWLVLLFNNREEFEEFTTVMALAAPYSAVCVPVIAAAFWAEYVLERSRS